MNKKELAAIVADNAGLSHASAVRAVDAALKAIQDAAAINDDVRLVGFGHFSVAKTPAREGRNPKTGEKIVVESRNRLVFRAGASLKAAINVA